MIEPQIGSVVEAGVDWLTVTCNDASKRRRFDELGHALLFKETESGAKCKPWHMSGFEGLHSGGCALGHREDMSLMRLSSVVAWSYWREAFRHATNCSRIDLQATVTELGPPLDRILFHHGEATRHIEHWLKKPELALRLSNRSSPTFYLNQRTSARFGRIYDKGDESGLAHYRNCIRFEVQYNDDAAWSISTTIAQRTVGPIEVVPYVAHFLKTRGVSCPWAATACRGVDPPRRTSNDESRLAWLRRQVAPAIADLLARIPEADVLSALGLAQDSYASTDGPVGPQT